MNGIPVFARSLALVDVFKNFEYDASDRALSLFACPRGNHDKGGYCFQVSLKTIGHLRDLPTCPAGNDVGWGDALLEAKHDQLKRFAIDAAPVAALAGAM
ncbi:hypothetical protein [Bradyrhizobium nanningense]|uniref:hypothetical protein n=1 Tax=Bradyrhizobium nanningense TaxID=1325118 RepID=UPI001008F7BE|nr:hypothetical protein [Bradyrhizobium nanningense]